MAAPLVQVGPSDGLDVTAPLLNPEIRAAASSPSDVHGEIWVVTPLPKRQVAVISFAALAEPVCVNFIYPFINEMIASMSSGPKQTTFRSGIFFGCFSLAQFCCVFVWGTLSDRLGRKPVILICLASGMISTSLFGLSTSFLQALLLRAVTGASYGDVPVLRSAMGDITDSTNQARAFSFIPLMWAVGSTLAPLMGGFLSHPTQRFPRRFGDSEFLKNHPYALPCFVSSMVSLAAFLIIFLFFTESLPEHKHDSGDDENSDGSSKQPSNPSVSTPTYTPPAITSPAIPDYGSVDSAALTPPATGDTPEIDSVVQPVPPSPENDASARPSIWQILKDPTVAITLLSYFFLSLISTANDVIFALWMFLGLKNGGVGLKPTQIATALSAGSILQTLLIVFLFPPLHKRFGTLPVYRSAMALDVVLIACYPVVHLIAASAARDHDMEPSGLIRHVITTTLLGDTTSTDGGGGIIGVWRGVPGGLIAGIAVMLVVKAFAGLTWGCNMILVTASAPSPRSLGAVNSLAQMCASLGRAVGPPIYSTIFAVSMGSGILGGKGLIWIFMGSISSISLFVSFLVREGEQEWRRSRTGSPL
ncbi:MFS general substrate transporter [Clavulina sp. PMI_390]|nr:MFS general substrate transporter [Clavulina sp. PMI_390]